MGLPAVRAHACMIKVECVDKLFLNQYYLGKIFFTFVEGMALGAFDTHMCTKVKF